MSLVNDMLRDLDKKPVPRGDAKRIQADETLSVGSRFTGLLPALLAFIAVGAAIYFSAAPNEENELNNSAENLTSVLSVPKTSDEDSSVDNQKTTKTTQTQASETLEADSKERLQALLDQPKADYYGETIDALTQMPSAAFAGEMAEKRTQENTIQQQAKAEESSRQSTVLASTAQESHIEHVLENARRALGLDRLTSPIGDNAFDYYKDALKLDAGNSEALNGLNVIAERYVELAQDYALEGNTTRAGVLLRRASAVAPAHPAIEHFWPNVNRFGYAISDTPQDNGVPVKTPDRPSSKPPESRSRVLASTVLGVVAPSEGSRVTVVRSAEWEDRNAAAEARALIGQGLASSARLQLRAFVSVNPGASKSVRVLFELLLSEQKYAEARVLLSRHRDLPGTELAIMSSYWFLAQKDLTGVTDLIDSQPKSYDQNKEYLGLKAGVLQKISRYRESAEAYQRLLQSEPSNTAYWLGLAVALDAMTEPSRALVAFQRALPGQNSADVRRYVLARIEALSGPEHQSDRKNTPKQGTYSTP